MSNGTVAAPRERDDGAEGWERREGVESAGEPSGEEVEVAWERSERLVGREAVVGVFIEMGAGRRAQRE
jgi:hypothetical protein